MKKILLLALTLCLFAFPALADSDDDTSLQVGGAATVTVAPDYATVTIGVSSQGDTVLEASANNAATMLTVKAALKTAGIAEKDISTSQFSLNPRHSYETDRPVLIGYQLDHMLYVTVRDLEQLGSILDAAMAAGANQMYGVNFLSTKQGAARDEALKDALQEANRKAEVMAAAIGKKVTRIESIKENDSYSAYASKEARAYAANDAGGTSLETGLLEVTASVTMTFEVE